MKAGHAVLVALAVAVTLTSVAAAGPDAAKQRVAITVAIGGEGVLTPLKDGALERDSGTFDHRGAWSLTPDRTLIRQGQRVDIHTGVWAFAGKRGKLVFRERNEWVDLGHDLNRDGWEDSIAIGTWKVVRGTGLYAGITGGGRSAHLGLGRKWVARFEGVLTVPTG